MAQDTIPFDGRSKEAITALYAALRPFATSKVLYLVDDQSTAQDIVQDVFEKLWSADLVFDDIKAAYQWVYVSCHNAAIDFLRKRKRRVTLLDAVMPDMIPVPKTPADRLANREFLKKILHLLDARESEVLAYLVIDGFTQRQIATTLNVSDKTVQRVVASLGAKLKPVRGVFYD